MSKKKARLTLLTGLTPEESADVESQHLINNGSMMLFFKDERRTMGYSTDGEFAFIGLDVRRQKGIPIDLTSLPNVEHQIDRLSNLTDAHLAVIEVCLEAEADATYLFTKRDPTCATDFIGYSNTTMPMAAVARQVEAVNESRASKEPSHNQVNDVLYNANLSSQR